jgi:hypothetical protein
VLGNISSIFSPFHSFVLGILGGNNGFLGSLQDFDEKHASIDARI